MKTIITLISILALQYLSSAQTTPFAPEKSEPSENAVVKSFYVSSSDCKQTKSGFSKPDQSKTIIISNIPTLSSVLNSVNIDLNDTGTYTFKQAPSLIIPNNQAVFIEDKVSGLLFNIQSAQSYIFEVEQNVPNRFVMHVLEKTNSEIGLTSN
jgi:hypothetical protein